MCCDICFVAMSVLVTGNTLQCTKVIFLVISTQHIQSQSQSYLLPPTKMEVNAFARVCLSVSKITQKYVHGFG